MLPPPLPPHVQVQAWEQMSGQSSEQPWKLFRLPLGGTAPSAADDQGAAAMLRSASSAHALGQPVLVDLGGATLCMSTHPKAWAALSQLISLKGGVVKLVHGQVDARSAWSAAEPLLLVMCDFTMERLHLKRLLQRHREEDRPLLVHVQGSLHIIECTLECEPGPGSTASSSTGSTGRASGSTSRSKAKGKSSSKSRGSAKAPAAEIQTCGCLCVAAAGQLHMSATRVQGFDIPLTAVEGAQAVLQGCDIQLAPSYDNTPAIMVRAPEEP